jgi:competence protein ComEC
MVLYVTAVFLIANLGDVRRNPGRWILVSALAVVLSIWHFAVLWPGRLAEVTFLDVGYGSATFVDMPDGGSALINAGPRRGISNAGKSVIAPFLCERRIGRLDMVVATGMKMSLIGGLEHIRSRFRIHKLVLPDANPAMEEWRETIGDSCTVSICKSPYGDGTMVAKVKYGEMSFLFPERVNVDFSAWLTRSGVNLESEMMVVPGHGNPKYFDAAFLRSVSPLIAVISVGPNPFGFPSDELVDRYADSGVRVLRTDRDGAVTVRTDGLRGWISTYLR